MATQKMRDKIIDTTMAVLADNDWEDLTLGMIASSAGISLAQIRDAYDGRVAVLADFSRRIDKVVLDSVDPAMAEEPARERLFDIVFSRFEALVPYRPAIRRLAKAVVRDPRLAIKLNRSLTTSMAWMLDAAGGGRSGPEGVIKAQGLAIVWGQVMRVWLTDEDPGHARTMAELDRRLRQAERSLGRLQRIRKLVSCRSGRRQTTGTEDVSA